MVMFSAFLLPLLQYWALKLVCNNRLGKNSGEKVELLHPWTPKQDQSTSSTRENKNRLFNPFISTEMRVMNFSAHLTTTCCMWWQLSYHYLLRKATKTSFVVLRCRCCLLVIWPIIHPSIIFWYFLSDCSWSLEIRSLYSHVSKLALHCHLVLALSCVLLGIWRTIRLL